MTNTKYRNLTPDEVQILEKQGCTAENWDKVKVDPGFQAQRIHEVEFYGENYLGAFRDVADFDGQLKRPTGIYRACLQNCIIGDEVFIQHVHNHLVNYRIGDRCILQNVNSLVKAGETRFGNGVRVTTLNETGGREVPIFNELSAHLAYIMALYRHRPKVINALFKIVDDYADKQRSTHGEVGPHTTLTNCNRIRNVRIGSHARIDGIEELEEGSINSNEHDPVTIGHRVVAREFIISSGSKIDNGVVLEHCFVGQGVELDKQYSAENSLFFSNCVGHHGEACSIFAGPFTVTYHKSTLLIAAYYSFLNAGSGSNQSNHMYKLGPIHQGIIERGSKTTSDSYLLWPAKVGPFTLVMGRHYKNSDTSQLPFSYLIESNDESILSPGVNLRSVGTIRDAQKWPHRDKRKDPVQFDLINFNLLSPFTIQKMWQGRSILQRLQQSSGSKSDFYTYENTKIPRNALERGIRLYTIGIQKFLGNSLISRLEKEPFMGQRAMRKLLEPVVKEGSGEWVDLAGLIVPRELVLRFKNQVLEGAFPDVESIQQEFTRWHEAYYDLEWTWAREYLAKEFDKPVEEMTPEDLIRIVDQWKAAVISLDEMLYEDARKEFRLSAQTGFGTDGDDNTRTLDFNSVRGEFEANPAVKAIREHIDKKRALGDRVIGRLKTLV